MKRVKYAVDVGDGEATGSVYVEDDATEDDILLTIMGDLYSVWYEIVEEE